MVAFIETHCSKDIKKYQIPAKKQHQDHNNQTHNRHDDYDEQHVSFCNDEYLCNRFATCICCLHATNNIFNVNDVAKNLKISGRVLREKDLQSTGRRFESRPQRCQVQPWASCLHTQASVTKQYNLVPANGR